MAVKKTPGPLMQKVKARVSRTKAVVGAAAKKARTLAKQEARVVTRDFTTRFEDRNLKTTPAEKRQYRQDQRRAERTKRIMERNNTGRVINSTGETLDRRKRVARQQIIEGFTPNTTKGKTKRQINKIADRHRADIMSKPQTMQEMRKQNKKKSKQASKCIPSGKGNNLCRPQGSNNEGGF